MFNWFKKESDLVDFKFIDRSNLAYSHNPPILAKQLKPLKEFQEKKYGEYNFVKCPGMFDYSQLGYIIPAWSHFSVKANKAGVAAKGGAYNNPQVRGTPFGDPKPMNYKLVDGMFDYEEGIEPTVLHFASPWAILHGKANISCLIMPAYYHSNLWHDVHIFPGIVDYSELGFSTFNFICSPKKKCEIIIKEGEPLLQIIPFVWDKTITASYGPGTFHEQNGTRAQKHSHEINFYRKFHAIRKKFKLVFDDKE